MFNRITNVALKEIIQLTRNWLLLILLVLGPTMELVLLARATGQGLKHLSIVVVDQDRSQTSRQIASALDNTEELDVVAYLDSLDQVNTWMEREQVIMAVILPPGLEADQATRLAAGAVDRRWDEQHGQRLGGGGGGGRDKRLRHPFDGILRRPVRRYLKSSASIATRLRLCWKAARFMWMALVHA